MASARSDAGSSNRPSAKPPEHVVTVEAIAQDTKTPIEGALVALHSSGTPCRNRTDDRGVAKVGVTKGEYELYVSKEGDYRTFQRTVEVASDVTIRAELSVDPLYY